MKIKRIYIIALGALSLLGVTATAIAAEEKPSAMVEKLTENATTPPEVAVSETLTTTAQVQAVDLKKRQLTLKSQEGDIFTVDIPPEVRRLAEIKAGDLIVTEYRQALAVGFNKTNSSGGIQSRRESVNIERAGKDQPPSGVARKNVTILASVIAIDRAKRQVTLKGAEHTVVVTASEDINLDDLKVGDEVMAEYLQELVINVEPAPPASVDAWKSRK